MVFFVSRKISEQRQLSLTFTAIFSQLFDCITQPFRKLLQDRKLVMFVFNAGQSQHE